MAINFIKACLNIVTEFFVIYLMVYATFLFMSVTVGSVVLYQQRQMKLAYNRLKHDYYVPISLIIPAYNEEVVIVDSVEELLYMDYKLYEIIVVDDGSTDSTAQKLIEHYNMQRVPRPIQRKIACQPEEYIYETVVKKIHITLVRKKNGGKADALNMGINVARFPYFICQDADSLLQSDSLENIIRPILQDENIIACGGMIHVGNGTVLEKGKLASFQMPKNWLVSMQIMEYDRSFTASRILFDFFNGNLIISGAFGLFKRDMVITVGGYDHDTMGEDMELVVKLHVFCRSHDIPYTIKYVPDTVCWSQAPESWKDLCKQRKRWHVGLFQSMIKHRRVFANPKYGLVSLISYLYYLLYELLSPYIELVGIFTVLLSFALNLVNVPFMLMFFVLYTVLGALLSLTAFFARIYLQDIRLSFKDVCKAIALCFMEIAGLRFALTIVRMRALIGYKDKKREWGEIKRVKMKVDS